MTDNEIIEALECCLKGDYDKIINALCAKCPYCKNTDCKLILQQDALDLINRQKAEIEKKNTEIDILIRKKGTLRDEISELRAEIERLQIRNKTLTDISKNYDWKFAKIKAEAIKEFAEKIYRFLCNEKNWRVLKVSWLINGGCDWLKQNIDNLVKEMTEQS